MSNDSNDRLADALAQAMIDDARHGYYDDFRSPLATPKMQLGQ